MEISKGRKLCRKREDRISSLPDAILHQILAYFPTDQVVRFSLLSTRWKYLWTSIPNLLFSYRKSHLKPLSYNETPERLRNFQNFVDRVLSHHEMSNIHKFSLWGHSPLPLCGSRFETWISNLSRHKLGELVLGVDVDNFTFPNFLSIFKSLTVLRICIDSVLCVPGSICFPNLKKLRFDGAKFSCDKSIQEVSFTFTVLEKLTVYDWYWLEIKYVNIYAPALKKFKLNSEDDSSLLYETKIKLDAMNLIALSILSPLVYEYSLGYLPSLFEASVDGCESHPERLVKCVTKLNHVKNFTLSDDCLTSLFMADISNNMQVFANLTSWRVTDFSPCISAKCLIELLCYMPNIECLYIELNIYGYYRDDDATHTSWTHETIPQCSLLNLKSVDILYFNGSKDELDLIAYLLVGTLEKMIISFNVRPHDRERKNAILTEVLLLPRGSSGTEVIVR